MLANRQLSCGRVAGRSASAVARPVVLRPSRLVARAEAVGTVAADVNDTNFDELVLKSKVPVLVDFWAPWCGPCRMLAPLVDELASEYAGKFTCVKMNTDESPQTASEYGVRSIPTVMVFKNGQKMDTIIGAVPKTTLVQAVEKYM
ncbi:MAG: thioredoxin [Monoraphidium minutum]|nr:MAG: thioredoxin [Monoraphidium minutum]